jgi:hypothetical protein
MGKAGRSKPKVRYRSRKTVQMTDHDHSTSLGPFSQSTQHWTFGQQTGRYPNMM